MQTQTNYTGTTWATIVLENILKEYSNKSYAQRDYQVLLSCDLYSVIYRSADLAGQFGVLLRASVGNRESLAVENAHLLMPFRVLKPFRALMPSQCCRADYFLFDFTL